MEAFEETIKNNPAVFKLLNDKEIGVLSVFPPTSFDVAFKVYIQDKYCASFKAIYEDSVATMQYGKINAFLRTVDSLASAKSKQFILEVLILTLAQSHEKIVSFKDQLPSDNNHLILYGAQLDNALSSITINTLNNYSDNVVVSEYKSKIVNAALDICDEVAMVNPKKEPFKYAIHNMVINNLEKIEHFGASKERFDKYKSKLSKKRTGIEFKYWIWAVVVVILIVLKFASKIG